MKTNDNSSVRILIIVALLGAAGVLASGCQSTPAAGNEPAAPGSPEIAAQEPVNEAPPSETGSTTVKVETKPSADTRDAPPRDPFSNRAEPFSEEKVTKLESMLKPIESVPTKAD